MQADFAVELGQDDDALEIPWASAEGGPRYYDLKRQPELLVQIEDASRVPALSDFLAVVNAPSSLLETAKCDAWCSTEINPEEEIFEASHKFGSYVDLLFSDLAARSSFSAHEEFVKRLSELLQRMPEFPAAAEFMIRRCYYRCEGQEQEGFYITFYLFGYGDDEAQSRKHWREGLKLVANAIRGCTFPLTES